MNNELENLTEIMLDCKIDLSTVELVEESAVESLLRILAFHLFCIWWRIVELRHSCVLEVEGLDTNLYYLDYYL